MKVESATMFESALSAAQGDAEGALRSAASLTRELRKAKAAAATGQVREYRRALGVVTGLLDELSAAVRGARASFDIDETAYLASGDYAKELLDLAAERGVAMFEEDERLLCYPSIVRVVPGDSVVEIDRRRERRLRPSVLIGLLAAAQQRPPLLPGTKEAGELQGDHIRGIGIAGVLDRDVTLSGIGEGQS